MTAIPVAGHEAGMRSDLNIWNCDACRCVHLRAGGVLLPFTREEFGALAHAVVEWYLHGARCRCAHRDELLELVDITETVN